MSNDADTRAKRLAAHARHLLLEFAHNCVAHPLLFWTRKAAWVTRFHDWSARVAWSRTETR